MHTGDWWENGEPIKLSALRGVKGSPIGIFKNIHTDSARSFGNFQVCNSVQTPNTNYITDFTYNM